MAANSFLCVTQSTPTPSTPTCSTNFHENWKRLRRAHRWKRAQKNWLQIKISPHRLSPLSWHCVFTYGKIAPATTISFECVLCGMCLSSSGFPCFAWRYINNHRETESDSVLFPLLVSLAAVEQCRCCWRCGHHIETESNNGSIKCRSNLVVYVKSVSLFSCELV